MKKVVRTNIIYDVNYIPYSKKDWVNIFFLSVAVCWCDCINIVLKRGELVEFIALW
jgi:hypothetical protein